MLVWLSHLKIFILFANCFLMILMSARRCSCDPYTQIWASEATTCEDANQPMRSWGPYRKCIHMKLMFANLESVRGKQLFFGGCSGYFSLSGPKLIEAHFAGLPASSIERRNTTTCRMVSNIWYDDANWLEHVFWIFVGYLQLGDVEIPACCAVCCPTFQVSRSSSTGNYSAVAKLLRSRFWISRSSICQGLTLC